MFIGSVFTGSKTHYIFLIHFGTAFGFMLPAAEADLLVGRAFLLGMLDGRGFISKRPQSVEYFHARRVSAASPEGRKIRRSMSARVRQSVPLPWSNVIQDGDPTLLRIHFKRIHPQ